MSTCLDVFGWERIDSGGETVDAFVFGEFGEAIANRTRGIRSRYETVASTPSFSPVYYKYSSIV